MASFQRCNFFHGPNIRGLCIASTLPYDFFWVVLWPDGQSCFKACKILWEKKIWDHGWLNRPRQWSPSLLHSRSSQFGREKLPRLLPLSKWPGSAVKIVDSNIVRSHLLEVASRWFDKKKYLLMFCDLKKSIEISKLTLLTLLTLLTVLIFLKQYG